MTQKWIVLLVLSEIYYIGIVTQASTFKNVTMTQFLLMLRSIWISECILNEYNTIYILIFFFIMNYFLIYIYFIKFYKKYFSNIYIFCKILCNNLQMVRRSLFYFYILLRNYDFSKLLNQQMYKKIK